MKRDRSMSVLAKDTAIYGISSIIGKFFNWLLVPLYSRTITQSDYGIISLLYAYVAVLIIILTYGMETAYFRFASNNKKDPAYSNKVYTTVMTSIAITATIFLIILRLFNDQISTYIIKLPDYKELVFIMGITVSIDAFSSIPFSYLRFKNKAVNFMTLKLTGIFLNIGFNMFFLVICPRIHQSNPELISWFYLPNYKVGYIVISNLIASSVVLLLQTPYIFVSTWKFDIALLKKMLKYSLPLLLFGIVGIMNQTLDRLIFPHVYNGSPEESNAVLGVYTACFKIAMVMMMFTYAFRFAYEPFIFDKKDNKNQKSLYSTAMTAFVISTTFIYLMIVAGLDILQLLLKKEFRGAINIVPFVLITYFFQGIFYNLSLWYKVTDKTIWGTYISLIGFIITFTVNIIFIPVFSYWACVFASMISFIVMTLVCYLLGQKYYPINYDIKKIATYFSLALILSVIMLLGKFENVYIRLAWRVIWIIPFVYYMLSKDVPIKEIIRKLPLFNKKNR